MANNTINDMHNPEIRGDQPHSEDLISDTHNEWSDATLVHDNIIDMFGEPLPLTLMKSMSSTQ